MGNEREVFGTKEWSESSINFINGCSHDCLYCYAKCMAIRFKRKTPLTWKEEEINEKAYVKKHGKKKGTIMIPSSHDITPELLPESIMFLISLLEKGNTLLIVMKPHLKCIIPMCQNFMKYKDQILFRFTIGSTDSKILKYWEPGAPDFEERLECLKYAHTAGFQTSVSSEPMLDMDIRGLVNKCSPYVTNSIWIGKFNKLAGRLKMNGCNQSVIDVGASLLAKQTDEYILGLYKEYKDNPIIKWKESLKKIIGIDVPTTAGLDI